MIEQKEIILLHKKRISYFDVKTANLKDYENFIQSIAICDTNSLNPAPDYWSEHLSFGVESLLRYIDKQLNDLKPHDSYVFYSKKIYYEVMLKKKRFQFQEPLNTIEYNLKLNDCKTLLELAFINANYKETIDYIIEHVELTNKIKNSEILMKTDKTVRMSVQESNKIHTEQVNMMKEFVYYLKAKREYIKNSIKSLSGLKKVDAEIELAMIGNSIINKEYYINQYDSQRRAKL